MAQAFKTVMVFGATSHLGMLFVDELLRDSTFTVMAFAKPKHKEHKEHGEHLLAYESREAKVIYGSLDDDDLIDKLRGVDVIISCLSGPALKEQLKIVKAAKEAGVRRFIPSEYGVTAEIPENSSTHPFWSVKAEVFNAIKDAGLEYTLFTNGVFVDIEGLPWSEPEKIVEEDKIRVPGDGEALVSWTHRRDLAKFIVASLHKPEISKNRVLTFVGDVKSWNQILDAMEAHSDKKVKRVYSTIEQLISLAAKPAHPRLSFFFNTQLAHATGSMYITRPLDNDEFPQVKVTTVNDHFVKLFGK